MRVSRSTIVTAATALVLIGSESPARAQTAGPFRLETRDYTLELGALLQVDGRFSIDDPLHNISDTFVLRRVRPILRCSGPRCRRKS